MAVPEIGSALFNVKLIKSMFCFRLLALLVFFTVAKSSVVISQQLSGNLKHHGNQEVKLLGYQGFETIELSKSFIDTSGNFQLNYSDYKGMGYLETSDQSQLFLVLNESQITVKGNNLKELESIQITNSKENVIFAQYASEHNQRARALSGWNFLLPQYKEIKILKQHNKYYKIIQKEINRLEKQDADFLSQLNQSSYVYWFLPLRKMLDEIPLSAQQYPERIEKHLADFRNIDFKDVKLYHSGILDDLLEAHYWLIENSGLTMDSMYVQMNNSTDILLQKMEGNEKLLNEVSDFLFHFLEKRSLYGASEYLAVKLLTQTNCTLNDDLAKQMETYRAMKVGNVAPDIQFEGKKMMMGSEVNTSLKLSDFSSDYTLVVFGASWCSKCNEEIPQIKEKYIQWKLKGLETVFISLDRDENEFTNFVKNYPFLSVCDLKGWENKAIQDYYVFAAPTLFIVDKNRKIILRPNSIEHVDAWMNYKIETK